jgi:predicted transcriptional regulator
MEQHASNIAHTATIVAAYVARNEVARGDLPEIVRSVHAALAGCGTAVAEPAAPVPAVPIQDSITPDALVCLEDGRKLKSLKRHLREAYGMTPEHYRAKWGLPASYPMVAPSYSERRSRLARELGLGRKPGSAVAS